MRSASIRVAKLGMDRSADRPPWVICRDLCDIAHSFASMRLCRWQRTQAFSVSKSMARILSSHFLLKRSHFGPCGSQRFKSILTVGRARIMNGSETHSLNSAHGARALWTEVAPWLAGAGIAMGHAAVGANCSVPQQGRCAGCGSCIVAVGALVGWALWKKHRGENFYADDGPVSR